MCVPGKSPALIATCIHQAVLALWPSSHQVLLPQTKRHCARHMALPASGFSSDTASWRATLQILTFIWLSPLEPWGTKQFFCLSLSLHIRRFSSVPANPPNPSVTRDTEAAWFLRLWPDKFWFRGTNRKTHGIITPQISPSEKAKANFVQVKKWIEKKANWTPMEKDFVSRSPLAFHPEWKRLFGRPKMVHQIYIYMLGNKFLRSLLKVVKSALPRRKRRAKENVGWDTTAFQTSQATYWPELFRMYEANFWKEVGLVYKLES